MISSSPIADSPMSTLFSLSISHSLSPYPFGSSVVGWATCCYPDAWIPPIFNEAPSRMVYRNDFSSSLASSNRNYGYVLGGNSMYIYLYISFLAICENSGSSKHLCPFICFYVKLMSGCLFLFCRI